MGKILVVAEKPSVGKDIARVLSCKNRGEGCLSGERYVVTWAIGHLVSLCEPDELDSRYKRWSYQTLPILPQEIPLKVLPATAGQYGVVSGLMNSEETDGIICATDAGREGELIFRYIYEKCACRKPVKRLWISSMTDEAIREGFAAIRPGADYDGLYRSAVCRSQADWLVGMNATRAFTLRYDTLLSVGRVQTPTLAILVKRRKEIESFTPEGFCTLTADFGDYKGTWFREGTEPDTHLKERAQAEAIAEAIKGQTGRVLSAQTTRKRDLPPQLYDLTSLQRDANKLLGFTADKTLKLAQSLYETHKALTYPRTDSRYLPDDMIPKVKQAMTLLPEAYQPLVPPALPGGALPVTRRVFDASKVSDHHALLPTTRKADLTRMNPDERQLWDLVVRRMLAAFYPPCEYDATRVITGVGDETFRTTGRVILENGWRNVQPLTEMPRKRKTKEEADEGPLPPLVVGDTRVVRGAAIKEDMTKPPAQHNDASLLAAMENAGREVEDEAIREQMKGSGIGTPATRAAMIERLVQVGYAARRGKTLVATDKGVQLIAIMPPEIASPETTGRWEKALSEIATGGQDPERFMAGIRKLSAFLVDFARDNQLKASFPEDERRRKQRAQAAKKRIARLKPVGEVRCPLCGEGRVLESERSFLCSRADQGCAMTLWKDCLTRGGGPELTARLVELLVTHRTVRGSTGVVMLTDRGQIAFYPQGSDAPSVLRPLVWERRKA